MWCRDKNLKNIFFLILNTVEWINKYTSFQSWFIGDLKSNSSPNLQAEISLRYLFINNNCIIDFEYNGIFFFLNEYI